MPKFTFNSKTGVFKDADLRVYDSARKDIMDAVSFATDVAHEFGVKTCIIREGPKIIALVIKGVPTFTSAGEIYQQQYEAGLAIRAEFDKLEENN